MGKGIGVTADPEVHLEKLTARSLFMVLASDGVFEFMSNQEVVDMVRRCACRCRWRCRVELMCDQGVAALLGALPTTCAAVLGLPARAMSPCDMVCCAPAMHCRPQ